MSSQLSTSTAIEFKGSTLGVMTALMRETEPPALADALHKMLGGMPDFFSGEPTVLDFSGLPNEPARIDWAGLLSLLRRYRMQPVGVRGLPESLLGGARQAGLAVLAGDNEVIARALSAAPQPQAEPQVAPAPVASAPLPARTMIVERPLRSGQQVYARGGDLVLLAGMSNGAEVIADGSIHCYGPLRGRAIAGAQGDTSARILTTNLGAELVSIAGVYRTFERGIAENVAGKAAHVRLAVSGNEQKLVIEALQLD